MSDLGKLFQLCGWGPKPLENFTTKVVAACRGTNAALEALFDQVLETGRAKLGGGSAAVQV